MAQALLYPGKFEVIQAASGAEGIELAARERPDCILLDFVLSDCEGPEVIDRIRSLNAGLPPVVYVTTVLDECQRSKLLEHGAVAVLSKPVNLLELPATIEQIIKLSS